MYFFLKPKCGLSASLHEHSQLQSCIRLPSACRITQLNIQRTSENAIMGQNFHIFSDDVREDQKPAEKESTEVYELNIVVRGFKEKFMKDTIICNK